MKTLLIIGGSDTALEIRECADVFYKDKFEKIYNIIGNNENISMSNVLHDREIDSFILNNDVAYIISFTNQKLRKLFNEKLSSCTPFSIIHPFSYIAPSAIVGKGTYVGATAVISSNAVLGNGCIVNIGVSIGHDSVIGNDCIFNPGSRVSGHCHIGSRTLIGANSFIFEGKTIGDDCLIDALTYIDRDIENKKLCTSNINGLKIYKNILY